MALGPGSVSSYNIAPGQSQADADLKRKIAYALMQQGMDASPVQHWTQGLARMAQGAMGGYELYQADQAEQNEKAQARDLIGSLMSGGHTDRAPATSPAASTEPRGIRNNNPLNLEASPFTQSQPGYAGSDGRFGKFDTQANGMAAADKLLESYGSRGINTVDGVINRWAPPSDNNPTSAYALKVAQVLGTTPDAAINLSDQATRRKIAAAMAQFENGKPLSGPVGASVDQPRGGLEEGRRAQLIQALAGNRYTAPYAQAMLQKQLEQEQNRTRQITDPAERAKLGIPADDKNAYQIDANGKIAAINPQPYAVNINNQGESAFSVEGSKLRAKRFMDVVEDAGGAPQMQSDLAMLRDLGAKIGTGKEAEIKAALGPWANALSIKIDGLGEIQAYEAIVNRLAPNLRVKGSGAQSDFELRNFMKSLPTIGNTPEGNEIAGRTMEGLYKNKLRAAEIASDALDKKITSGEAEKLLRELPDPMREWREFNKKNPVPRQPAPIDRGAIEREMQRRRSL